ncbi:ras guanine nucleotide exchange factor domain-containing protein [Sporodiniella umbellata]|nr:ras guanine nucleotide exchange factor domain-containing protein [Sporodiniella umbellata]
MTAATIPSIVHFQPGEVAYQITRIESAIFFAIPTQALLTHSPKSPHPRIVASTDFFNFITRMIEHSILLPQEASVRAQHIHHWIKVVTKCQDLNNYQTLKAITSALGTPPVQRLKRSWSYVPKRSQSKLDAINELMSESHNYVKYREYIECALNGKNSQKSSTEQSKKPIIPFLGTFIHDMTYLLAAVQHQEQTSPSHARPRPTTFLKSTVDILQSDSRVQKLLSTFESFKSFPPYNKRPGTSYTKNAQRPGSPVRPAFSQALQRSKSSFGRLGGAIGLGSNYMENSSDNSLSNDNNGDFDVEEQSNLVIQYILMRPWVSQDTVDELSVLREPPRAISKPGNSRSNSVGSHYTGSLISNTSSLMRLSTSCNSTATIGSSSTFDSRPDSFDDIHRLHGKETDSNNLPSPLAESTFHYDSSLLLHQLTSDEKWNRNISIYDKAPIVPPRPKGLSHKIEKSI